jgi:hypothetical protein
MQDVAPQYLDSEVLGLEEEAVSPTAAMRMDLGVQPLGAVHAVLVGLRLGQLLLTL